MHPESSDRATFDHGADDPRFLIYLYQQRLRNDLLLKAAEEARRSPAWVRCIRAVLSAPRIAAACLGFSIGGELPPSVSPGLSPAESAG
jgi:hypothetical protein